MSEEPIDPLVFLACGAGNHLREFLRNFLGSDFRGVPTGVLATALVYEMIRLVAREARTEEEAQNYVDRVVIAMRDQIATFGVERDHP